MSDRDDGRAQADYDAENACNIFTLPGDIISELVSDSSRSAEFQAGYDERMSELS